MTIHIKRAYERAETHDGYRVLVDRIWPRGVSKEDADLDVWAKEIAPSTELRKWFDHDVSKWSEFEQRFRQELKQSDDAQDTLKALHRRHNDGTLTLVFAAKDTEHNNAVVLKKMIAGH